MGYVSLPEGNQCDVPCGMEKKADDPTSNRSAALPPRNVPIPNRTILLIFVNFFLQVEKISFKNHHPWK